MGADRRVVLEGAAAACGLREGLGVSKEATVGFQNIRLSLRMSLPQLQVGGAGRFILRHFLGCVRCFFSSENGGESPEVPMTDDLPEMLFGE